MAVKKKVTQKNTKTRAKKISSTAQSSTKQATGLDYTNEATVKAELGKLHDSVQSVFKAITKAHAGNKDKQDRCSMVFAVSTPFGELLAHAGQRRSVLGLAALSTLSINESAAKSYDFEEENDEAHPSILKDIIKALKRGGAEVSVQKLGPDFKAVSPHHTEEKVN